MTNDERRRRWLAEFIAKRPCCPICKKVNDDWTTLLRPKPSPDGARPRGRPELQPLLLNVGAVHRCYEVGPVVELTGDAVVWGDLDLVPVFEGGNEPKAGEDPAYGVVRCGHFNVDVARSCCADCGTPLSP